MLLIWTIQPATTWAAWQRAGRISATWQHSWAEFRRPYEWMAKRLGRLVPAPSRHAAPVWAWFRYNGEAHSRPDLRRTGHLPPGTHGARLELILPASRVLLSDFDLWHYVLNNWPIPVATRARSKNWDKVFDLDYYDPDVTAARSKKSIQAVFWEAPLSAVRAVDFFVAR
jgi:hypothetical protein